MPEAGNALFVLFTSLRGSELQGLLILDHSFSGLRSSAFVPLAVGILGPEDVVGISSSAYLTRKLLAGAQLAKPRISESACYPTAGAYCACSSWTSATS